MKSFEYTRPTSVQEAVQLLSAQNARALGGGTDLLGIMKDALLPTDRVVDLKGIQGLDHIKDDAGTLAIGALARLGDIASSSLVSQKAPALAQAAGLVASPQIRNMGTLGGNLAQKVRCWYFRDADRTDCYKRNGSYCYAVLGASDLHAVFGGAACFAVHPSDTATALSALDASVVVAGPKGQRTVPIASFFVGPDTDYLRETVLAPDEIITEVRVPPGALGAPSVFLKAAPRRSIDFARTSVGAQVVGTNVIQTARIALGAVAPTPHRATKAEAFLEGKSLAADTIAQAAELAADGAKPLASNAYKVPLIKGLVRQALTALAAR
ncbi:MAG: xanthine dehydrogenase family protein subunit M [Chloroflexota bacterium]|nr:xanthine dehydrogenase family protein subunit M [Chloroflexota bacterium]MDE3100987.1 xanthine dehydrogenase family protein subunit M [Chloroflexota bacterium]